MYIWVYYLQWGSYCWTLRVYNGEIFQPDYSLFSSNSLGYITKWSGANTDSDAAFVPFSSVTTNSIYPNVSTAGIFADNQYGIQVGDTVYTQGISTGTQSGAVTNIDKTINSAGTIYIHQRTVNITVQGGDSGGAVYGESQYDPGNMYHEGIISSGITGSTSYSQIYRVINTLGL